METNFHWKLTSDIKTLNEVCKQIYKIWQGASVQGAEGWNWDLRGGVGGQQAVGMGRPSSQVGLLWTALVKAKDHCDGQTVEQRQKKGSPRRSSKRATVSGGCPQESEQDAADAGGASLEGEQNTGVAGGAPLEDEQENSGVVRLTLMEDLETGDVGRTALETQTQEQTQEWMRWRPDHLMEETGIS